MKLNCNFLRRAEVQKQKTFCGGSMDISWNCTIENENNKALKQTFHEPKSAKEESTLLLENVMPKSTHLVYKWFMKIFCEWLAGHKDEQESLWCQTKHNAVKTSEMQDLQSNILYFVKWLSSCTCQLSQFCQESPSFLSNLPVSWLDHQISQ